MSHRVMQCVVFVVLFTIAGCRHSVSPVLPSDRARGLESWTSPLSLYTAEVDVDRFWDVDLATVVP